MPTPRKRPGEEIVDADGERHDVVDLLRRGPAERRDVLLRHHRVVELVVLVVELDDRARQLRAFLDAEALRQRAGGDVAHDDLERDDLHLADQLLAHVEPANEMRRHPDVVEVLEHVFRDAVVEDALAFDDLVLLGVEGGRVVLEMLNQSSWLGAFIEDLRLAFIDAATAAHRSVPWFVKVHRICRGSCYKRNRDPRRRAGRIARISRGSTGHIGNLADRSGQHNRPDPVFSTPHFRRKCAAGCCLDPSRGDMQAAKGRAMCARGRANASASMRGDTAACRPACAESIRPTAGALKSVLCEDLVHESTRTL